MKITKIHHRNGNFRRDKNVLVGFSSRRNIPQKYDCAQRALTNERKDFRNLSYEKSTLKCIIKIHSGSLTRDLLLKSTLPLSLSLTRENGETLPSRSYHLERKLRSEKSRAPGMHSCRFAVAWVACMYLNVGVSHITRAHAIYYPTKLARVSAGRSGIWVPRLRDRIFSRRREREAIVDRRRYRVADAIMMLLPAGSARWPTIRFPCPLLPAEKTNRTVCNLLRRRAINDCCRM